MTTNGEIRSVIVDALEPIPELNVHRFPPENAVGITAFVAGFDIATVTYEGGRETTADILVTVPRNHVDQLDLLDDLLDPDGSASVVAALEAVTDVDGVSLSVQRVGDYGEYLVGTPHYGAKVTVRVWT